MSRRLTPHQEHILERLRQREMPFLADATERHRRRGKRSYLDTRSNASGLRRSFEQGNREVIRRAECRRVGENRRRRHE